MGSERCRRCGPDEAVVDGVCTACGTPALSQEDRLYLEALDELRHQRQRAESAEENLQQAQRRIEELESYHGEGCRFIDGVGEIDCAPSCTENLRAALSKERKARESAERERDEARKLLREIRTHVSAYRRGVITGGHMEEAIERALRGGEDDLGIHTRPDGKESALIYCPVCRDPVASRPGEPCSTCRPTEPRDILRSMGAEELAQEEPLTKEQIAAALDKGRGKAEASGIDVKPGRFRAAPTEARSGTGLSDADRELLDGLANYLAIQECDSPEECAAFQEDGKPCLCCQAAEYDRTRGTNAKRDNQPTEKPRGCRHCGDAACTFYDPRCGPARDTHARALANGMPPSGRKA